MDWDGKTEYFFKSQKTPFFFFSMKWERSQSMGQSIQTNWWRRDLKVREMRRSPFQYLFSRDLGKVSMRPGQGRSDGVPLPAQHLDLGPEQEHKQAYNYSADAPAPQHSGLPSLIKRRNIPGWQWQLFKQKLFMSFFGEEQIRVGIQRFV